MLNLCTGHVSPQFNVVFDDEFSTVPYLASADPPPNWLQLLQHSTEKATKEQYTLSNEWLHPPPLLSSIPVNTIFPEGDATPVSEGLDASPLPSTLNINQNAGDDDTHTNFVDVEYIGLHRITRSRQAPE